MSSLEDVNADGFPDLVFHVRIADLDLPVGADRTEVVVTDRARTDKRFAVPTG